MLTEWFAGKRWGRETRRSHAAAARTFYRWAVRHGMADDDPTIDLPGMKPKAPNPRPAPADVLEQTKVGADDRVSMMVSMASELGMRRGEVAVAHRDDLSRDIFGEWWLVVHGKGGKLRRVPVAPALAATIRRHNGYLFPGRINGHLAPSTVGRLVSHAMPEAWTMHTLRHRFATIAYDHERDIFAVQQLLGHASPATTQRYVLVRDQALRRTVEAVSQVS